MFCWSLFVLLYLLFWPLCCMFFFDIQILITLWCLQTLIKDQRSKFDRNCIVCHPSIVLSVILPLYFLSSFHIWLSITLLLCSRISQKSAQLWQNNIKKWRASTRLISTTRVAPSLSSLNTKTTTTYDVDNPRSGLQQALNVEGIHQLVGIMGSQASHLENCYHYCPNIIQN